ncbi:MAG: ABC transporter permease subunit [Candidatus Omnitrophota bacterium]
MMRIICAMARCMIKELIRKKDFYVLLVLLIVLMTVLSYQSFFNIEGISRYVKDLGYTMVMLFSFLLATGFAAKQIPSEIESSTILPLLAKPLTRYNIILGKFFGSSIIAISAYAMFFLVFAVFSALISGVSGVLLCQGFFLGMLFLFLVCSLVIFFSTFMTTSSNVTISILIYLTINGFSDTLKEYVLLTKSGFALLGGLLYYLIPHFDFFDMRIRITHSWDPLPVWVMLAITVYTVIYSFVILYCASMIFGRKRL